MKGLREDLHRYRILLPCAIAAVLLLRWATMRGRPERLIELPLGSLVLWGGVVNGEAITYGISGDGKDFVAYARPVDGGRERLLVRHPSPRSEVGAFISDGYLYYVNVWYGRPRVEPKQTFLNGENPLRGSQIFSPNQALTPRAEETSPEAALGLLAGSPRGRFSNRSRTTIARVPIAGGPVENIDLDSSNKPPIFGNVGILKGHIFWTRRVELTKAESARLGAAKTQDQPPPVRIELLASPASGGAAKLLHSGVYEMSRLLIGDNGVYCRMATAGTKPVTDVVYVDAGTLKVTVRRDSAFESMMAPVAFRNRIWWINDRTGDGGPISGYRRDLMSANPDGSDPKYAADLTDVESLGGRLGRLFVSGGKLYGTLAQERPGGPGERRFVHFLAEVDPDQEPMFKTLTRLPRRLAERGVFDGGYYYFIVNESQDSLFDWSAEESSRPDKYYLYRWKLPVSTGS
jgi:hypothetical protein